MCVSLDGPKGSADALLPRVSIQTRKILTSSRHVSHMPSYTIRYLSCGSARLLVNGSANRRWPPSLEGTMCCGHVLTACHLWLMGRRTAKKQAGRRFAHPQSCGGLSCSISSSARGGGVQPRDVLLGQGNTHPDPPDDAMPPGPKVLHVQLLR